MRHESLQELPLLREPIASKLLFLALRGTAKANRGTSNHALEFYSLLKTLKDQKSLRISSLHSFRKVLSSTSAGTDTLCAGLGHVRVEVQESSPCGA